MDIDIEIYREIDIFFKCMHSLDFFTQRYHSL